MCNRFENKGSVSSIREKVSALSCSFTTTSATDNLRSLDNVYPDQDAPILINQGDKNLELTMARWGFPPIPGETAPITNIRNLKSSWWHKVNSEWLTKKEFRCLVPFTAFAEPVRDSTWFIVPNVDVAYFAGVWRPWQGERLAEQPGQKRRVREVREWKLFSFLTTEANNIVRPVHEKAMPVIVIDRDEQLEWLNGGENSLRLQRPLADIHLQIRI